MTRIVHGFDYNSCIHMVQWANGAEDMITRDEIDELLFPWTTRILTRDGILLQVKICTS